MVGCKVAQTLQKEPFRVRSELRPEAFSAKTDVHHQTPSPQKCTMRAASGACCWMQLNRRF